MKSLFWRAGSSSTVFAVNFFIIKCKCIFLAALRMKKKLPYTIETATLTRKRYPMLRTTIQSLNLFLPGLIYGPKICIETVQLHSYLLRSKGAFLFIILIIIHSIILFFSH